MSERQLKFHEALREAADIRLAEDKSVYIMGLGVPDPKGVFGTTLGLAEKYGPNRVMDMPTSENAMTGVAVGSAICGMRPILTHQRVDFALLSLDQIINNAAKWRYMFGGRMKSPLVIRLIVGRGWGQGPQHSQSLESLFGHIPGLRVVAPATPHDAKGLLIAASRRDDPVIFLEHRWLHGVFGPVPEGAYETPLDKARIAREGKDVTIVAASYSTLEALKAAEELDADGISAEVLDARSIRPLDEAAILASVEKTGRLVSIDMGWREYGFSSEVLALASERAHSSLKAAPRRVSPPSVPSPSSWGLTNRYYPRSVDVADAARATLGKPPKGKPASLELPLDVPDKSFSGPF